MKTLALRACPTCGAEASASGDFDFHGHPMHRCSRCGTVYAGEYADPDEVYVDGYLCGGTDFGLDVRHPIFQEWLAGVGERRCRLIERHTGGRGRLLDVGCGTGEFTAAAQRHGFEVQGVEPEASGAEMARSRGLDVRTATLEESGLPERSYDVVSAFHVLEHLPDSRAFLRTLARWCRPGGHVVVEVPNFASVVRRRSGPDWIHLRPLEHLVYHSPASLRKAFAGAGLEPVVVTAPTWIGPPQTLDQALDDLGRPRMRKPLALLSPWGDYDGAPARIPSRPGWTALRAVEAVYRRRGAGMVVFGIARV